MTDVLEQARTLTRQDLCDGCRVPAASIAVLESGSELMFCNHHLNKHHDALVEAGATIIIPEVSNE